MYGTEREADSKTSKEWESMFDKYDMKIIKQEIESLLVETRCNMVDEKQGVSRQYALSKIMQIITDIINEKEKV